MAHLAFSSRQTWCHALHVIYGTGQHIYSVCKTENIYLVHLIGVPTDPTFLMTDLAPPGCFKESEVIGKILDSNWGQKPVDGFRIDSLNWNALGQQYLENTPAGDFVTKYEREWRYLQFLGLQEISHAGDEARWISNKKQWLKCIQNTWSQTLSLHCKRTFKKQGRHLCVGQDPVAKLTELKWDSGTEDSDSWSWV